MSEAIVGTVGYLITVTVFAFFLMIFVSAIFVVAYCVYVVWVKIPVSVIWEIRQFVRVWQGKPETEPTKLWKIADWGEDRYHETPTGAKYYDWEREW
jgi:hypothetical protein